MDELIEQLNELRINRDNAARDYQRSVDELSRRESTILAEIRQRQQHNDHQQRQRQDGQFRGNIRNNRHNPITQGNLVRITNDYKLEEKGVVGRVTHVTNRMVQLRAVESRKLHTRAWWNVEQVEEATDAQ